MGAGQLGSLVPVLALELILPGGLVVPLELLDLQPALFGVDVVALPLVLFHLPAPGVQLSLDLLRTQHVLDLAHGSSGNKISCNCYPFWNKLINL